jgi:hypothetical protein
VCRTFIPGTTVSSPARPPRLLDDYAARAQRMDWDMSSGFLPPKLPRARPQKPAVKPRSPLAALYASQRVGNHPRRLDAHAGDFLHSNREAALDTYFQSHSTRGALSTCL